MRMPIAVVLGVAALLSGCHPTFMPAFSPSGRTMVLADPHTGFLYRYDVSSRTVEELVPGCAPVFVDETTLVYAASIPYGESPESTAVYRIRLGDERPRLLYEGANQAWWTPITADRRQRFATLPNESGGEELEALATIDVTTGATRALVLPALVADQEPVWFNFNGSRWFGAIEDETPALVIVTTEGDLVRQVPGWIQQGAERVELHDLGFVALSGDDRRFAVASDKELLLLDLSNPDAAWVRAGTMESIYFEWSPDGSRLAAAQVPGSISLIGLDGRAVKTYKLLGDDVQIYPRWSPDNRHLACIVWSDEGKMALTAVIDTERDTIDWPSYRVADLVAERLLAKAQRTPLQAQATILEEAKEVLERYLGYPRGDRLLYDLLLCYLKPIPGDLKLLQEHYPESPFLPSAKEAVIRNAFGGAVRYGTNSGSGGR